MKRISYFITIFLLTIGVLYFVDKNSSEQKVVQVPQYSIVEYEQIKENIPEEKPVDNSSQQKLLDIHNKERTSRGKQPLTIDKELEAYSQKHAEWMASKRNMKHSDLSFPGDWSAKGENIAYGYPTEEAVMDAWMHSSGHKANILRDSFTVIGLGIAETSDGTKYWCACFGRRPSVASEQNSGYSSLGKLWQWIKKIFGK